MKTNFIKLTLVATLFAGTFTSCINDDDYATPPINCTETNLVKNKEVATVPGSATVTQYTADDIIEAYVTSSDEGGNFFKSISFQTLDGSRGFSVPVDVTSTFARLEPGRKVLIKLKDLYTDISNGGLRIGGIFVNSSNIPSVGRLSQTQYNNVLNPSCTFVKEDDLVRTLTINQLKNDANINTLVELDMVQLTDASLGKRYFDPTLNNLGGATNHLLSDASGNTIIFRVSEFALFASRTAQNGSGKVRGVLTKFGSDYQFLARTEEDIKLDNPRIDLNPPVGGTAITYTGAFTENFESYTNGTFLTGQRNFPKYINDAFIGGKYWFVELFGTNKYLKMTSFNSNTAFQEQNNKVYFIVPVDFTAANSMSFKTQDRFNNGGVLKVYHSTNYNPLGDISAATLTNITSNFTIATGTTGSASLPFVNSTVYNFPTTLTGNGFIIFEYTGGYSTNVTTTMHIDDIVVN